MGAGSTFFYNNGSPSVTIDSSGRVGIGTTSPSETLEVAGNAILDASNANLKIKAGSTGTTGAVNFTFNTDSTVYGGLDLNFDNRATDGVRLFSGYPVTIESQSSAHIAFRNGATERVRIDTSGRLLVGTSSARSTGTQIWPSQIETAGSFTGLAITANTNTTAGAYLSLAKSRGSAVGSNTIVQNGDGLGYILFSGADGTDANTQAAFIGCEVDGTPGANDMPGRLVFSTTADGASSPTERMRIESNGRTKFSGSTYGVETTITTGSFNMAVSNFWTCGAIAIPNPTNGVAGMSGLIRVTAAPTSFGSNWDFPGGSYTAPTTFPAVAPFYCVNSTTFYLGNWTEGIA